MTDSNEDVEQDESILSVPSNITYCAWIYPGAPATNAPLTYRKYKIDILRAEYFTVTETGVLKQLDLDINDLDATANAFSLQNIADIKKHSKEQLVTVSSGVEGMRKLFASIATIKAGAMKLRNFVVKHGLTGVDLDFEQFSAWEEDDYTKFKTFVKELGSLLCSCSKKLAICGPMWTSKDNPFHWNYEDFKLLPVTYISPMTYDYQYDFGGGSPVAPLKWLQEWAFYMLSMFPAEKVIMGLPSYGYSARKDEWDIKILTLDQIKKLSAYQGGVRDPSSAEVMKTVAGRIYVSNDALSLNRKRDVLVKCGIKMISVWHLGGNEWFSTGVSIR